MKTRTLAPAQQAYALALAAYQLASELAARRTARLDPLVHTALQERSIDELRRLETERCTIEDETGRTAALRLRIQAERDLLAWGRSVMAELPQYRTNAATLEPLWTSKLHSIREKLIDICMRLDP